MGKQALALPQFKELLANVTEIAPHMALLAQAGSGKRATIKIPETVLVAMKGFARVEKWIHENRVAYDRLLEGEEGTTTTTKGRTRSAGSS